MAKSKRKPRRVRATDPVADRATEVPPKRRPAPPPTRNGPIRRPLPPAHDHRQFGRRV